MTAAFTTKRPSGTLAGPEGRFALPGERDRLAPPPRACSAALPAALAVDRRVAAKGRGVPFAPRRAP